MPSYAQGGPDKPREGHREQGRRSSCNVSVTCSIVWVCFLIVSFSGCSLVVGSLWNVSVCFLWGRVSVAWEIGQRRPERPKAAHRGPYKPRESWRRPDMPREAQGGPKKPRERQGELGKRKLWNVSVACFIVWVCF